MDDWGWLFTKYLPSDYFHKTHDLLTRWKHIIPFVGYPVNRGQHYAPFFIVGSGRSGNTLLRRVLYAHSGIHIPPETFRLGPVVKLFRQNRNLEWKNLVHLVLSEFEYHPRFETFEVSLRPLALQLITSPKNTRSLAFILDSFYRYHAEQKGRNCVRWGDKTPINVFWLDTILSVFPDAQFIHIIRDGVDVVFSYLQAGIYQDIETAAKRWSASINAATRFRERHRKICFEIRYEDLVREPETNVRAICDFLKIEYEAEMLVSEELAQAMGDVPKTSHLNMVGKPISTNSIGKGRRQFTSEEREKLQQIIGRQLAQLGYEPSA